MKQHRTIGKLGVFLGALLFVALGTAQAQTKATASGTATFTVTAVGKKEGAPTISKDDVQFFTGKERKQIVDWKTDDNLFLAILIDDSIVNSAAGQWNDLKEFIMAQPATTHVAVGYIRNNSTQVAQDFTTDHELATKALRIPIGTGAIGSSPYLGTMDMLKRWPQTGPRRSILLISSGIDFFRGSQSGAFYPDLDGVIQRAERQNTNIWTIYYPSAGHHGRGLYYVTKAQNNLGKLSDDTGAESYYLGAGMPVSLKPNFDEIAQHLSNQYLLTFAGSGGAKGKYQTVKVKTPLPDVEFFAPAAVFLPPGA
ncbi:MAG TPA: hypothetical protein VN830_03930 [Verrucomicrobiae bacterium]|nr:hypothetical protein [Verrucomicrobiae bacterium]